MRHELLARVAGERARRAVHLEVAPARVGDEERERRGREVGAVEIAALAQRRRGAQPLDGPGHVARQDRRAAPGRPRRRPRARRSRRRRRRARARPPSAARTAPSASAGRSPGSRDRARCRRRGSRRRSRATRPTIPRPTGIGSSSPCGRREWNERAWRSTPCAASSSRKPQLSEGSASRISSVAAPSSVCSSGAAAAASATAAIRRCVSRLRRRPASLRRARDSASPASRAPRRLRTAAARPSRSGRARSRGHRPQPDLHDRAALRVVLGAHLAAVVVDDPLDDREPEARAARGGA